MTANGAVVVPAVPPRPSQVNLVTSAVSPASGSDPAQPIFEIGSEQLELLPAGLVAELKARQGDAWIRGITYAPESHAAAEVRGPCSSAEIEPGYGNLPPVTAIPYTIVVADECSSFGFEERDFKGRAQRLLENATPSAIEHEFWTGEVAQAEGLPNNYLTNPESVTDLTPATAPSVARGMQILQDAIGSCGFGGQGMIHTMYQTAPNLLAARRVGPLLLDVFDNIIVPGAGYPGTGPGGEEPTTGTAWMYATDLVMVRAQDEGVVFPNSFSEALDREHNLIRFYAEKFAVAYFDAACHFAVKVTLAT